MSPRHPLCSSILRMTSWLNFVPTVARRFPAPFADVAVIALNQLLRQRNPPLRLRSPLWRRLHNPLPPPSRQQRNRYRHSRFAAIDLTAICCATTGSGNGSASRAAPKIFRRRQGLADRRRNCSGHGSRRVWRCALWRPLGQAQSIFYYWRIGSALKFRRATCASCSPPGDLQQMIGVTVERSAEIMDNGDPGCAYYTNPAAFAELQKLAIAQAKRDSERASQYPDVKNSKGDNPLELLKHTKEMEGIVKGFGLSAARSQRPRFLLQRQPQLRQRQLGAACVLRSPSSPVSTKSTAWATMP